MGKTELTGAGMLLCFLLLVMHFCVFMLPSCARAEATMNNDGAAAGNVQTVNEIPLQRPDQPQGRNPFTGSTLLYFPPGDLYRPYAADPFRVGFGIQPIHASRSTIIGASNSRVSLRAGGQLGVIRSEPGDDPAIGWQLSLTGGFNDQNDVRYKLDNIGWDGRYGFLLSVVPVRAWAFKTGLQHVSSHVGDEWIKRTGRQRIGYTRQEVVAGISWLDEKRWRLYSEAGWAMSMSNKQLQEPWRLQGGMEYESPPVFLKGLAGWYAATDIQSTQERDWHVDIAIQTGFVVRSVSRTWRLGAEWYKGRPPIGEFFQDTEQYISIGLWIDI